MFRKTKGIPEGGQFAPRHREEPVVGLVADPSVSAPQLEAEFLVPFRYQDARRYVVRGEREVSLWDPTVALTVEGPEKVAFWDSSADDLLAELETGAVHADAVRKALWNALSTSWGVPPVFSSTVSGEAAAGARRIVTESGGVRVVCHTYLTEWKITEPVRALMLPFCDTNPETIHNVFDVLATKPSVAQLLWESALVTASTPFMPGDLTLIPRLSPI